MTWHHHPQHQQRGSQITGGAPDEAVRDRAAQDHDRADLDLSATGEPRRDIDYPATNPEKRAGDVTPVRPEGNVNWDDVVQPEDHARQARPSAEQAAAAADHSQDDLPLPDGK